MMDVFESSGFEYKILRPIQHTRDGEPVLLATRREYLGVATTAVDLRPLHVTHENAQRVRARLSEELQLSRLLRHPHVGEVLGVAVNGEQPYVVMEHVSGCSLETALNAAALVKRKVSIGFATTVAQAVAEALEHAHQCVDDEGRPLHAVHRAVAPANIQISQRGRVKLVNFGSAYSELFGRPRTPEGLLRGAATYAAPEVLRELQAPRNRRRARARAAPGKRADIFSLGLVLLGALTGWHPLDPPDSSKEQLLPLPPGTQAEVTPSIPLELLAARLLRFGPKDVERAGRGLPARLRQIVARALRVDPSERYPSALALADELRGFRSAQWPQYREQELAAEVAALISAAKKLDRSVAYSVTEPGVLPAEKPWRIS